MEYILSVPSNRRRPKAIDMCVQSSDFPAYPGQRVLAQGPLPELMAFVREHFGQDNVPHLLSLVAEVQLDL
jgi:hypothetical protein